jgi:hypothetical protein
MADGPVAGPELPTREGWPFPAKHDGICHGCESGVLVGERIVRMSDGNYRHVGQCERTRRS